MVSDLINAVNRKKVDYGFLLEIFNPAKIVTYLCFRESGTQMARDNFSSTTSLKLQKRVNSRCSNPNCRVPTNAPQVVGENVISIGEAAHICAASAGGPRFDPNMTAEQRKSFNNGIWLCSNCATKIDRDTDQFSVDLLRQWKREAENSATLELGRKLPHSDDAKDTLISALTGSQKRFIPDAISNIHKATSSTLESLDPRFKIYSSYINETAHLSIHAKEDVSVRMVVKGDSAKEFEDKFTYLRESGKDIDISTKDISFEGSKLFEEMMSNVVGGVLRVSTPKRKATFKLWVKSVNSNEIEYFEDVIGEVTVGSKEASFYGVACKNIFELSLKGLAPGIKTPGNVTITLNLNKWAGVDVRLLPYFSSVFSFFEKLAAGWVLHAALQIDGINILTTHSVGLGDKEFIYQQNSFFQYTKAAQTIATFLNTSIVFNPEVSYSIDEYLEVLDVARTIKGTAIYQAKDINSDITCDLILDDKLENFRLIESCNIPTVFQIVENQGVEIAIFGKEMKMPPIAMIFNSVLPKIISRKRKLKPGDTIKLQMVPSENFKMIKHFCNEISKS